MLTKFMTIIRKIHILACFLILWGMNYMFCVLYCGEVTDLSLKFSAAWALFFCGILVTLPIFARKIGIIGIITFHALMCLVHAVMNNLFGSFFSFSDLLYTGDGAAFFSFSYINARKLLWATVIASIIGSIVIACSLKKQKYKWHQLLIGAVCVLVGICGISSLHNRIMGGINTEIAWDTAGQKENDADMYQNMSNKNYVMSMTGIYQYLYRSFMVTTGIENKLSNSEMYDELDEYFSMVSDDIHVENEMSGIFEGKNLMFIMLESIDEWMITEEYMPNLYQLQKDSISFVNHFSPLYISAGTFNTEFIANTSIIPPASGVDNKVYKDNYYPYSLANSFKKLGYTANSFHSSNPVIYNRGEIHENLGYLKYHNWVDMNMENYMLDSQMTNGYSKMVSKEPFLSFLITYSGHGPYTEEMNDISVAHMDDARKKVADIQIEISAEDLEEYTRAIAHITETDIMIGQLVENLKADGMLEDTVLVFFTDHYSKYMTNHELIMELKQAQSKDFLCNTPFFIYHEGTEPQVVETVSSSLDILPTIANMFALDVEYKYFAGIDIFSQGEHYVIFVGNGWYDGETYYTAYYDGEMTEEIIARNKEIVDKMRRSELILKSDYYSYLYPEK